MILIGYINANPTDKPYLINNSDFDQFLYSLDKNKLGDVFHIPLAIKLLAIR